MNRFPFSLSVFLFTVSVFFRDVSGTSETVFGPISVNNLLLCQILFQVCPPFYVWGVRGVGGVVFCEVDSFLLCLEEVINVSSYH